MKKLIITITAAILLVISSAAYAGGRGHGHGFHGGHHGHGFHGHRHHGHGFYGGYGRYVGPAIGLGIVGAGVAAASCWQLYTTYDGYGYPVNARRWVC